MIKLTVSGFRDACTQCRWPYVVIRTIGIVHQTKALLLLVLLSVVLIRFIPSAINPGLIFALAFSSSGKLNNACAASKQSISASFSLFASLALSRSA